MKRKRRMLAQKNITAQEWKVNNGKIEVIPFFVKPSSKFFIVNVCLFVLRFYGPVNPMGSCRAWSVS